MSETFTVAIDGPVAAGKTTIGRLLAARMGALFFDTGIVYRAVAHQTLDRNVDPSDDGAVATIAEELDIELKYVDGDTRLVANGTDISDVLRTPEIDRALPPISANPKVRSALLECQRSAIAGRSAVVVGRDIGTVILPDADLKIFLDADMPVRAQRRHQELQERGIDIDYQTVLRDLIARDQRDAERDHAPLAIADDALVVDASEKTIDEVVSEILELVSDRKSACQLEA